MLNRFFAILAWLVNLFAPPPLDSMSQVQKIGRVFVFTTVLVVICILLSMLAALGIFALEQGRRMIDSGSELLGDLGIIFVSMAINTLCVMVLLEVRKADHKLIPPSETQFHRQLPHDAGGDHARAPESTDQVPAARPDDGVGGLEGLGVDDRRDRGGRVVKAKANW